MLFNDAAGNCTSSVACFFSSRRGLAICSGRAADASGLTAERQGGRKSGMVRFLRCQTQLSAASAFRDLTVTGSRTPGSVVSIAASSTTIGSLSDSVALRRLRIRPGKSHNKPLQIVVALVGLRRLARRA